MRHAVNSSLKMKETKVRGVLPRIEQWLFTHRLLTLLSLAVFTAGMAWFAV